MADYDLVVDFMDMTAGRHLWTRLADARSGFEPAVGGYVVVGAEDSDPAVARIVSISADGVDVVTTGSELGGQVTRKVLELELRRQLSELNERSRRLTPGAVAELRAVGLTVRDVAELLGVTPSRISQIEHGDALVDSGVR